MTTRTWTQFTQKVKIKAGMDKVYHAWTSQDELEKWFLRLAEFRTNDGKLKPRNSPIQQGDTYLWRWHGYPDEMQEQGKILETNGKDKIRFEFGKAGNVQVSLSEEEGYTLMEITQTDIPVDENSKFEYFVGCQTGWTFYRANLKSILEGGLDLRNKSNVNDYID